ncbi:MAG: right-handed parallel beta-helix repeat-containing protein, partial [Bacteroidota bacterium]
RNTIEHSLAVGNQIAGIMLELRTTQTLVQHNVVAETRWRAWSGAGILSQAASRNAYLHNTLVANEGTGLWLRLDPDRRADDGSNTVLNNRIVGNAASGEEAREVSVEGTTLAHVRSNTFDGNLYGVVGGDLLRSTFYLFPVPGEVAGFRSDDLDGWRRLVEGDRGARLATSGQRVNAAPLRRLMVGAQRTQPLFADRPGADMARVRASGNWADAPRPNRPL